MVIYSLEAELTKQAFKISTTKNARNIAFTSLNRYSRLNFFDKNDIILFQDWNFFQLIENYDLIKNWPISHVITKRISNYHIISTVDIVDKFVCLFDLEIPIRDLETYSCLRLGENHILSQAICLKLKCVWIFKSNHKTNQLEKTKKAQIIQTVYLSNTLANI